MTREDLVGRSQELMEQLPPAPWSEPPTEPALPEDDELASEELSVAVNAPEASGPLP
jgi:hypothetical protein